MKTKKGNPSSTDDTNKRATTDNESIDLPVNRKRKKKTELELLYDDLAFIYSQNNILSKKSERLCMQTFDQKQESVIKNVCCQTKQRKSSHSKDNSNYSFGSKSGKGNQQRQVT